MKFIFLMDPLETVLFEKDTTLALMLGSRERGHEVFFLPSSGISLQNGKIIFHTIKVIPQRVKAKPFIIKEKIVLPAEKVDAVFIRTDPPFNEQYLQHTWFLDRLPSHIAVINRPNGIRTVNEKIWATQFTKLVPATLVSQNRMDMINFIKKEKNVIAKPTNGHGGRAVFHIKLGDTNINVILESLSENFTTDIILQGYVPAATKGDKRIILLNGEPLGAVLRVHSKDDHRNNFFAGGKPAATKITTRDHEIIETLKPYLRDLGLYFVGIDILGEYLIEVNVTSPTGLQEMNRLYKKKLEDQVIRFVEKLVLEKSLK